MNRLVNPMHEQEKQDVADVRKNYTRTPNMLIFGYSNISPQEKWLYVCLNHLCGARGTRYLALRYISEQTGISVGALSKSKNKQGVVNEGMIRHLHDAGLIHSEIKKKDGRGNALYHITITDVWALNQEFFIERKTRSDFGQSEEDASEPVRTSDIPVQISDKTARNSDKLVQISDEPVRKPVQIQDYNNTTNKIIDKTNLQESTYTASESQTNSSASANASLSHAPKEEAHEQHPHTNNHGASTDAGSHHPTRNTAQTGAAGVRERNTPFGATHSRNTAQTGELAFDSADGQTNYVGKVWPDGRVTPDYEKSEQQNMLVAVPTKSAARTSRAKQASTSEPKTPRTSTKPAPPEFTEQGRKVYDAWCTLFKSPPPAGPQTITCANALYPLLVPWCKDLKRSCALLLDDIKKQMYKTDKTKFYARGITLCDVHRDFEKWQSAMTQDADSAKPKPEDDPYTLEALFARHGETL